MLKGILQKMDESVLADDPINENLEIMIMNILNLVHQTHIYHILTKSYSEHMAIGEFYEDIQEDADAFAESYIGLSGGFNIHKPSMVTFNVKYDKDTFIKELEIFRSLITSTIEETNRNDLMSINGILVDIQGDIDKLFYKLGFNS